LELKEEPIHCYLCLKDDFWRRSAKDSDDPQDEVMGWMISNGASKPDGWCHDYHNEGNTIYFCSKQHRDLWRRAVYLSWQAVALLKEFAKSLKDV
jgi:hypothetical protein